jgi:hypothetical protein
MNGCNRFRGLLPTFKTAESGYEYVFIQLTPR